MKNSILFKIKSFRSKSVRIEKLFPLPLLRGALGITLRKAFALTSNNQESVLARLKVSQSFLSLLLKMHRHHGPTYTVKWMKACAVALQKSLGGDKISSLRVIEPNVPMPRLINSLPAVIYSEDRRKIRDGDVGTIRY